MFVDLIVRAIAFMGIHVRELLNSALGLIPLPLPHPLPIDSIEQGHHLPPRLYGTQDP